MVADVAPMKQDPMSTVFRLRERLDKARRSQSHIEAFVAQESKESEVE